MAKRYVDNSYNRSLGRVGMVHGTAVVSRSGGGSSSGGGYSSSSAVGSSSYYGGGSTSSTTSSQRCYVDNAYNRSLGRVGMAHGTAVVSRSGGGATSSGVGSSSGAVGSSTHSNGGGATGSSQGTYADNAYNRKHGRVGKEVGTHVISKSGEQFTTSRSAASTNADGFVCYADNPRNRKLGRVGKPIGTHVQHKDGSVTISDVPATYKDNTLNQKLNRVGDPIRTNPATKTGQPMSKDEVKSNRSKLISEYSLDDLVAVLLSLGLTDPNRMEYQNAVDVLEQEKVEEDWKRCGLEPATDISCLSDHTPGQIIPFSELEISDKKPIGRGGFGEVYAGKWHGTPIAYKKLLYQQMSRKLYNSFTKEMSILAMLNHPCTIRMFGAVVEPGNIGIVMEYMRRSLHRALHWDEESFPESKKKSMVDQIASALEYLHGNTVKKIAHCDIKPANILLDKEDNVKLTDFGISVVKNATETSQSTAAAPPGQGTPRYSAPEVLRGELLGMKQLMQTDIYSLAVVVFEILSEEEPYFGLNARQLEAQVGRGTLRPTSDDVTFSQPINDLLKRCWDRRADARPSAAEFRGAWSEIHVYFAE